MNYPSFWKKLRIVEGLEKLSTNDDAAIAKEAQLLLAETCDDVFSLVKTSSDNFLVPVLVLRDSARGVGEKFAASPDVTAELLQKLATAAYVDDLLEAQLEKLSGETYDLTRHVQMLGREYAVTLMRGLFS